MCSLTHAMHVNPTSRQGLDTVCPARVVEDMFWPRAAWPASAHAKTHGGSLRSLLYLARLAAKRGIY